VLDKQVNSLSKAVACSPKSTGAGLRSSLSTCDRHASFLNPATIIALASKRLKGFRLQRVMLLTNGFHQMQVISVQSTLMRVKYASTVTSQNTKAESAILVADIPPSHPTLNRRRARFLIATLANPETCFSHLTAQGRCWRIALTSCPPVPAQDDSGCRRISKWYATSLFLRDGR